ncbi:MAG: hypothetical protein Q8Q50_12790 [Methylobacter sp.]|jgi:hypothetical protein|nr:hypothetical protein [Methylobacter sp.]
MKHLKLTVLWLLVGLMSANAFAETSAHADIELALQNDKIIVDPNHKALQVGNAKLYEVGFDNSLTPFITKDPGLNGSGFSVTGSLIGYHIENTLKKWDSTRHQWLSAGFNERIAIAKTDTVNRVSATEGLNIRGLISQIDNAGKIHSHLSFQIDQADEANPDDGAYLLEMSLFATEADGVTALHTPSDKIYLAFHLNAGGTFGEEDFEHVLEDFGIEQQPMDAPRVDALFDWAEAVYPELFPKHEASRYIFGYYARCYDNDICLGAKDGHVFVSGGSFGALTEVGSLHTFFDEAGL